MSAPAPRPRPVEDSSPAPHPTQDDLYAAAISEYGPALARLAAACERDRSLQQDLLQDIHVAVWRSFATFRSQCSLRTWVYRVAHNTSASFGRRHRKFRREQWSECSCSSTSRSSSTASRSPADSSARSMCSGR